MSVNVLNNRSLAAAGCVGALSAAVGGALYVKTASVIAGVVAAIGLIVAIAVVVFAAYKYYYPDPPPASALPPARTPPPDLTPSDLVSKLGNTAVTVVCILKFLPEKDILSAELVSKGWKTCASSNSVWKHVCDREGIPPIKRPGIDSTTRNPIDLVLYKAAYQHLYPIIFGPKQYSDHLGIRPHGEIVRLEDGIHEAIDQLDPTHQKKYMLFYLSRDVERSNLPGSPVAQMTINLLGELMQAPGVRHQSKYAYIWPEIRAQHGDETLERSNWILMSTDIIPGTRNASFTNQVNVVSAIGARAPKLIEGDAGSFFIHARFGTFPFGRDPWTYSRTKTTVTINNVQYNTEFGGFGPSGLYVFSADSLGHDGVGMAAVFSCGSSAVIGT